jgi:hypothetical protein
VSFLQSVSVVHLPQLFAFATPQICPVEQSASDLQSPCTQDPAAVQRYPDPYAVTQDWSVVHLPHSFAIAIPQMPPLAQSDVAMQLPGVQLPETQTYPEPLP